MELERIGFVIGSTTLDEVEREMIRRTVKHCKGKISEAAAVLGISRKTIYLNSTNKRLEEELREAKDEIRMLLANLRADDIRFTRYREAIEPARLALSRFNEKKMREGYHVALQEHAEDLFHILSRLTDECSYIM